MRLRAIAYCAFLSGCFTATVAVLAADTAPARPNIIVILADDLGYSDLECYGGEIHTPHINALAAGGVRMTQVYNSARCCPSRASLMTGLYPTQAGIGDFTTRDPSPDRGPGYLGRLNESCVTIAEALKPAGYGCYYVGKWHMHPETGPITRGFDEFYGYTDDHSHDQYDKDYYIRLPEGRAKEIDPPADEFYATDVFSQYAIEFIQQGQESKKPWFLFLGHSSPHFPIQAPPERADPWFPVYLRGWDVLRSERYARMKELGLVNGDHWTLSERSVVPVDRNDIANGFSGQENPPWDSLPEDRQRDLARRMAIFAAMVQGVDHSVGMITKHLQRTGELNNTLILFLSDNGACYEWGPFGFDGVSRRGENVLRTGDQLREIGGRGTHQAYGSAWANLGNTPLRMYKHFTHEGGISTPFIAHWPDGLKPQTEWIRQPAHVMDVMPTILDAIGVSSPATRNGEAATPIEGISLLPALKGERLPERILGFDHQAAHAIRKGDWKLVWSKRMPHEIRWELYNLAEDRCEIHDLANQYPERVESMASEWEAWARRVGVTWEPTSAKTAVESPAIANRELRISVNVRSNTPHGVAIAQGGNQVGYAIHFETGIPMFDVRVRGRLVRLQWPEKVSGDIQINATLTANRMTLQTGNGNPIETESPGLIPNQPVDGLSIGFDDQSAAGDYKSPNPLQGEVIRYQVTTR
ncbi:MAG: arylsulfatase [Planctomycetaceae bacterium]|nr:arylsulfatase [Planctomycetaceae bacterium]